VRLYTPRGAYRSISAALDALAPGFLEQIAQRLGKIGGAGRPASLELALAVRQARGQGGVEAVSGVFVGVTEDGVPKRVAISDAREHHEAVQIGPGLFWSHMREEWIAQAAARSRYQPRDVERLNVCKPATSEAGSTWWQLPELPEKLRSPTCTYVTLERVLMRLPEGTVIMAWRYQNELYVPYPDPGFCPSIAGDAPPASAG